MQIKQRETHPAKELAHLPPLLQRIYSARGITHASQLDKGLPHLLPYHGLSDIDKACTRLGLALEKGERILIIGDFDADGATSTALAVSALKAMGAAHVDYLVPNRFEFGYGLTPAIVEVAKTMKPHLIITVDNGISSIEGVAVATAEGIDVLITDHHLPGDELPKACAIVNPNQHQDGFLSKSIAGVGVIFYVMLALRRWLVNKNWFVQQAIPEPNMAEFLDLVALGTVADVVALDQNNRILVNQGLTRIRQGKCRKGILALIAVAGRKPSQLRESDLGFAIAPRLNAAGRLEDMSLGIECLLCEKETTAQQLAEHLDNLNQERRVIEAEMKEQAFTIIEHLTNKMQAAETLPRALCLMDPSWHQGVIGILAGRLKERYHRPVIIFAKINDQELKGSARSVLRLNIRDALAAVDQKYPGLIIKFGGHAMAAGLSIAPNQLSAFRQAFIEEVSCHIDDSHCTGQLLTDGALEAHELSLETALLLQQSGPWGQQFPEPCFDNIFELIEQRLVGQQHLKLTLALPGTQVFIDAIAFNISLAEWPNHRAKYVRVVYKLDINLYQGRTRLQLLIEAIKATSSMHAEQSAVL